MKAITFITLFLFTNFSFSQYLQDNCRVWFFGDKAGLNFNTTPPSIVTGSQLFSYEGCMTLSKGASVFFYTNGISVWNASHQVMPNGSGLLGNASSTQSGLSVPIPLQSSLYYIFTVDANEHSLLNGLRYSLVDMTLNSAMGDVTSTKNVLLHNIVAEKITVIPHANNIDYWIIAHEWGTNKFLSYLITTSGLTTIPVISSIGSVHTNASGYGNSVGYMKGSPDGTRLAVVLHSETKKVELFDFDRSTGMVSNPILSNTFVKEPYGVEFSPDGKKLYVSTIYGNSKLYQFDITTPNFFNNGIIISTNTSNDFGAITLAYDGKLYVALNGSNYISAINSPNSSGTACNLITNAVNLGTGICYRGLPNMYYYNPSTSITKNNSDKIIVFPTYLDKSQPVYVSGLSSGKINYSLTDISGKIIINNTINNSPESFNLNTNNIESGIYILNVEQNNSSKTTKLIIK